MCGAADLIWLESPSNPLLAVADLDLICTAPRKSGAIIGVDNTFATPLNQRPLALGADVAVQSVTKFIGGHSDLLGGVVTVRDTNLLAALRQSRELRKKRMSAAGRKAIAEAQRKRWAASRGEADAIPPRKPKRKLSAAGRAAIVAALKKRWAAKKVAKK